MLGRGGEGEVHEAQQLAFGRMVAIKTLRGDSSTPRMMRRFRSEAAVTAFLEHPNIVPVHDLRVDQAGRLQLVMKRVSGRTWRAILEAGTQPIDEHVAILLKVCDAVEFAHGKGILHRDLKPENVMVGAHGEVLVMDWGCAAQIGPVPAHPDIPLLADLTGVSGTPSYMSPEQARGDNAACGAWSDVHLLGASLYHALAKTPPRRGDTVLGVIASATIGEPLEEPATRIGRRVSAELSAVAMGALQPDAGKRARTVSEFAASLRRYLDHRSVLELVAEARRQHEVAKEGGVEADDAYRRALSAAEQAAHLWPELLSARRLLVVLGIDSAKHACEAGSLRQAMRQARMAASVAERLGDGASAQTASRIAIQASALEGRGLQRERTLRRVRAVALIAGIAACASLVVGLLLTSRESARTAAALTAAREHLEQAETERAGRLAGERLAAPALLSQAREFAMKRRFAEGVPLAEAAAGFAPDDPQPPLVKAQLLIALGRRTEAIGALDAALRIRADPMVGELRHLCASPPADGEARIADVLVRMGAGAAAGALNLAADRRMALAIAQLRKTWPSLPDGCVRGLPDGTLNLRLTINDLKVDSLEPLRGLPVSSLDLTGQERLRDLGPLASLPLSSLTVRTTGVRDFSPLRGLPLRRLAIGGSDAGMDFDLLRGAPLEAFEGPAGNAATLAAFAGMPLRELRLYGCTQLADLAAVRGLPLEVLTLDAPRTGSSSLTDLSPLRGMGITELALSWQRGVTDLSPLHGMPMRRLVLNGTGVTDLSPVIGPATRFVAIGQTPITDVRPLLALQLETVDISPQSIRQGLDDLIHLPTLRLICGFKPADFQQWVSVSRRIVDANPDYAWNGSAVFADGRLIEVRIAQPLRSLAPFSAVTDLRVLHLGGQTTDVRPLAGLHLTELVFVPIRKAPGLDDLRRMSSLTRIGASAQTMKPAADYWSTMADDDR